MNIKVICSKCDSITEWKWGKQTGTCECCDTQLNVKEVKIASGEIMKIFQ